MSKTTSALCALLSIGALGCGQPLATGSYLGEPLLEIVGNIVLVDGSESMDNANLRVAVRWLGDQERVVDEQILTNGGLGRYALRLFEPAPETAMREIPGSDAHVAFARVLLYDDLDGDDVWDPVDEPLRGGDANLLIAYAPDGVSIDDPDVELPRGFSLVSAPPCQTTSDEGAFEIKPTGNFRLNLVVLPSYFDGSFDLDCDGQYDDPCFELIQQLEGPEPPTEAQLRAVDECYAAYHDEGAEPEEICFEERVLVDEAYIADDVDLFNQRWIDYEQCLSAHDPLYQNGICPEGFLFDPASGCLCTEPYVSLDPWTCVDCSEGGPLDPDERARICPSES